MKKILLLSVVVLLIGSFVDLQAQAIHDWSWSHPRPVGQTLRWCQMLNANTYYACGYGGNFLMTTDAGYSWMHSVVYLPWRGDNTPTYDAHFFNFNTGLIAGYRNIYRTTDAGCTWDTCNGLAASSYWNKMSFINSYTGFATGTSGRVYKTTNAGLTWTALTSAGSDTKFSIYAINENIIMVGESGADIWRTTNGGMNWTEINMPGGSIFSINFIDANTGFACGSSTTLLKSTNSGAIWSTFSTSGIPLTTFYDIDFGPLGAPAMVYVTGNYYAIYRSPITSPSWDTLGFIAPNQTVTSTYYSTSLSGNGDSLLTVGAYGLINKRNNISNRINFREDWTWMTSNCNAVGVIGNVIMIPSSYSAIWYTTNNGTNWDTMKTNTTYSGTLYSISTYGNNAWVCGGSGKVNKSTDGGVTWSEIYDVGSYTLYHVNFVNTNTGWVFGSSGSCYKSTNGGTNFTQQTVPGQTSTIYGSSFIDANTGWNCGNYGRIYKTTNGGITWTPQTSKTTQTLRGIDFTNANKGWLVGYGSTIRKTTNGGIDWDTLHTPFYPYINHYGVDFFDHWNGMIIGDDGLTLRTRDGGTYLIYENTGGSRLYGVKMTSAEFGWACGSNGYIFKYDTHIHNGNIYTHVVPKTYELNQNYPNPFNPTTTIQFALPKPGRVSLKVYDVSGRLIRILINNEGLNEGTFKHIFDGSNIASGVYFYSLIVNDELIGTKKMVLIK